MKLYWITSLKTTSIEANRKIFSVRPKSCRLWVVLWVDSYKVLLVAVCPTFIIN